MARLCTICTHPQRSAIAAAMLSGEALRRVAPQFGISDTALRRHRKDHLPIVLGQAHQAAEIARADDLLDRVRVLEQKAEMLLASAEQAGDVRTALLAIREARGCLELLAKLLGELDERPQVNLLVNPEWLRVRDLLLDAL